MILYFELAYGQKEVRMKRRIRNVLAVITILIMISSAGVMICKADMPNIKEIYEAKGYTYCNSADEAYNVIVQYLNTDLWPEYESYNNGSVMTGGIKVIYPGDASNKIDSLDDSSVGNGLYSNLKESIIANDVKTCDSVSMNGAKYTGYHAGKSFRHANEFYEALTKDEYNQGVVKAAQLASQFNYGSTYEKALRAYNYLTANVVYDKSYSSGSIYSALIENNTVCLGFAEAFFEICKDMGLDIYIVNVPEHSYNIINIDSLYYIADSTWDSGYNEGSYRYCFKGTNDFDGHDYQFHTQTYGINIAAESYNSSILYYSSKKTADASASENSDNNNDEYTVNDEPKITEEQTANSEDEATETSAADESQNDEENTSEKSAEKNSLTISTNGNGERTVIIEEETAQSKKSLFFIFLTVVMVIIIVWVTVVLFITKRKKLTDNDSSDKAVNQSLSNITQINNDNEKESK